jgi:hypothetical protein
MPKTLSTPAVLLLALMLRPDPAPAQPGPAAREAGAQEAGAREAGPAMVHLSYTGSALGLEVMKLDAALAMDRAGYRVDTALRTVGLLAGFAGIEQHSTVQGNWRGVRAEPRRFWSWGHLRGDPRETLIDYENGSPAVRSLIPPNQGEREEVPASARGDSVDALSAIVSLVRRVAETGNCDGRARVFDGRRLSEISVRTVGQLRGEAGSFQGEALRCDFAGRQLAGFMLPDSDWQRRPHGGSAWLARAVPAGPPLPVRLTFETSWVGDITLVLTDAGPGPLPQAAR